jgi:hypothetical protein
MARYLIKYKIHFDMSEFSSARYSRHATNNQLTRAMSDECEKYSKSGLLNQGPFGSLLGTDPVEMDGTPQPPLVGEGVGSVVGDGKPPYSVVTVTSGLAVGTPHGRGLARTTETRRGRIYCILEYSQTRLLSFKWLLSAFVIPIVATSEMTHTLNN